VSDRSCSVEDCDGEFYECPECRGSRTLDGITDEASAAAWLDCTTCSAIPKQRLGVNEYGTPVSIHVCSSCGDEFTVCPPAGPNFGEGCLAPLCPSYIERDVDYLLAAGQSIHRSERPTDDR